MAEVWLATVFGNETVGDDTAKDHTDGLEDGQQSEQKATILRYEFKANSRVDGDVASNSESIESCDDEKCRVGVTST